MSRLRLPLMAVLLVAPALAGAHVPPETTAELRLREGTVELSLSVSALHLLEQSGEAAEGSGPQMAARRVAAAIATVSDISLRCGEQPVALELAGRIDGDALVAASAGSDRRLSLLLRGDRPPKTALEAGCALTLPTAFGPYYAAMSEPVTRFAAGGGTVSLALAPASPPAPQSPPAWRGWLFAAVAVAVSARIGFGLGRRNG